MTSVSVPVPLNLVVAAIVLWNTVYLERAVETLRASGTVVPDELRKHLSPLAWEHIVLTGEYRWGSDQTRRPGRDPHWNCDGGACGNSDTTSGRAIQSGT